VLNDHGATRSMCQDMSLAGVHVDIGNTACYGPPFPCDVVALTSLSPRERELGCTPVAVLDSLCIRQAYQNAKNSQRKSGACHVFSQVDVRSSQVSRDLLCPASRSVYNQGHDEEKTKECSRCGAGSSAMVNGAQRPKS
jgi:hypothetical protein